jgi:2-polyprenyl-6-methoxyphenol hydroxylase-like FAD-dependent oxidoreductase
VLLGDAAHATTPNLGQGGCQAIEDGWALAEQLATHTDPARAFAAYERVRKPKAERIVRTARLLGDIAHLRGGLPRALRDAALRATPASVASRQSEWIYRV